MKEMSTSDKSHTSDKNCTFTFTDAYKKKYIISVSGEGKCVKCIVKPGMDVTNKSFDLLKQKMEEACNSRRM